MPTFGFFALIGLILGIISIRTLIATVRHRKQLFDTHFTPFDRQRLTEAAFFLLLPVSVLLHEVGHAVAVLLAGGQITGFGFFFFSGYVAYTGVPDPEARFWIALAGPLVNVLLALTAVAIPLLRPLRAPYNFTLFAFAAINIVSSLVFYPLIDFIGDLHGDFTQIYTGGAPELRVGAGIVHLAILIAAIVAWRSERGRLTYARLTDLSPDAVRRVSREAAAAELLEAGARAASDWRHPVRVVTHAPEKGPAGDVAAVTLHWSSNGSERMVGAYAIFDGRRRVEIHGGLEPIYGGSAPYQRLIRRLEGIPTPDKVEPALRDALERVERWSARAGEETA